jgi:organic radical activating enzyme
MAALASKIYIKRLSILGGEPLIDRNIEELIDLCTIVKKQNPSIKI